MSEYWMNIFLGLSMIVWLLVFMLSGFLRKSVFYKIAFRTSVCLSIIGIFWINPIGLPKGMIVIISSMSLLFILMFDALNRLFYKINGYYPWSWRFEMMIVDGNLDRYINKPEPQKPSHLSNLIYQTSLYLGFPILILMLIILSGFFTKMLNSF